MLREPRKRIAEHQTEKCDEQQRYELDDGGRVLEGPREPRCQHVPDEAQNHERPADQHLQADARIDVEQNAGVDADRPGNHDDDRGEVTEDREPADRNPEPLADERFGIGDQAPWTLGAGGELAEPGCGEHVIAFEEDARADADSDDHRQSREEAVLLLSGRLG